MLSDKALLIRASWGRPTQRKTDRGAAQSIARAYGADDDRYNATKRLWKGSVYDKIVSLDNEMDKFIKFNTLPWLDDGWRVLSGNAFFDVTDGIRKRSGERETLVAQFVEQYDEIIRNEQARLGQAFNADDYDPDMHKRFTFDVFFMPIPEAGDFRLDGLSAEDIAKIEADTMARVEAQLKPREAWERIHEQVSKVAEKLRGYTGTKDGSFRDSLIENLRALVDVLPNLNITGDQNLAAMHKRLKDELCPFDPDTLRSNDIVREDVASAAERILREMSIYMG